MGCPPPRDGNKPREWTRRLQVTSGKSSEKQRVIPVGAGPLARSCPPPQRAVLAAAAASARKGKGAKPSCCPACEHCCHRQRLAFDGRNSVKRHPGSAAPDARECALAAGRPLPIVVLSEPGASSVGVAFCVRACAAFLPSACAGIRTSAGHAKARRRAVLLAVAAF